MIVLVTGGAASGKSELAEEIAVRLGRGKRLYIATMQPYDGESVLRIERHRRLRAGKGFDTVERYSGLTDLPNGYSSALLECMSNLLANCMFGEEPLSPQQLVRQVLCFGKQVPHLVVVTNEVFSDGVHFAGETETYQKNLGYLNQKLAQAADVVLEAVCGLPVVCKGELPCR